MKSKKMILIIILACVCLAIAGGIFYWQNRQLSNVDNGERTINDEWISVSIPEEGATGTIFVSADWYFVTPNPGNLVRDSRNRQFRNNMLRITAEPDVPRSEIEELARVHDAEIKEFRRDRQFGDAYTFIFDREFTFEELEELSEKFLELDIVRMVRISRPMRMNTEITTNIPNDPRWHYNWGLEAVNAPSAWAYSELMEHVNVLVVDSGFYRNHEDLYFRENRTNFTSRGSTFNHTHGTHVAGIIGARFNNGIGISGIVPNSNIFMYGVATVAIVDTVTIYTSCCSAYIDVREFDSFDETELMDVIEWYVIQHGVRVINFSMGDHLLEFAYSQGDENARIEMDRVTDYFEKRLLSLIERICEDGYQYGYEFIFVTSAGNQNGTSHKFIADANEDFGYRHANSCEECGWVEEGWIAGIYKSYDRFARIQNEAVRSRIIVVGAVDRNGHLAPFSQRGNLVDVTAPGIDIYSTYSVRESRFIPNRKIHEYKELQGTSMSAPFVSGLATMLFGINPDFTGAQVREIIVETAGVGGNLFHLMNRTIDAAAAVRVAIAMTEAEQTEDLYNQVRQAYYEFLRQRGFEAYTPHYIPMPFIQYAIIDIDGDGIPELIVDTGLFLPEYDHEWGFSLIFSFDVNRHEITYISGLSYLGALEYSERLNAFASFGDGGWVYFQTLNDLRTNSISLSLMRMWDGTAIRFDEEQLQRHFNSVGFERLEDMGTVLTEEESNIYMEGLRAIEFVPLPISEQSSITNA